MRTTLDIDDDVLEAARELAKAEHKTMGEVISDLARRALTSPAYSGLAEPAAPFDASSWPTFPDRGGPLITNELVRQIQDEIDREDAVPFDFTTGKPRIFSGNK